MAQLQIKKALDELTTLRDEVRVKLHLAGMDAKQNLSWLDDQIAELEKSSERALTDATRDAITKSIKKLEALKSSLA